MALIMLKKEVLNRKHIISLYALAYISSHAIRNNCVGKDTPSIHNKVNDDVYVVLQVL